MRLEIEYVAVEHWPPLAWAALCTPGSGKVYVQHGHRVETTTDFFCEAVWSGPFADGAFDRTDLVSGSGGRVRDDAMLFVSSGSTIDRLHVFRGSQGTWISNSLPCIVQCAGLKVDPTYRHYYRDFHTIIKGLRSYERLLQTDEGPVELVYFDNVRWDGVHDEVVEKPELPRDFSSFSGYSQFLLDTLTAIAENMRDGARRFPYSFLATVSSGYDSATVATLASEVGCSEAMTFLSTHRGEDDSGRPIADALGLKLLELEIGRWRSRSFPEVPFLASNAMAEEVRFEPLRDALCGRVLLTGFHGDKVWGTKTTSLGGDIVRGDPSGLGLSEFRLWAGFINCAPAFWGVRQIRDIVALSNAGEMEPWDVGGDYSRPICRRIVEGAGVDRSLFGQRKLMASVILHNSTEFLTPGSMHEYALWIKRHRTEWLRAARIPPFESVALDRWTHWFSEALGDCLERTPGAWRLAKHFSSQPTPLRRYAFPWALELASRRYDAHAGTGGITA